MSSNQPTSRAAAICIATYRRPDGLAKLLRALAAQPVPAGWSVEVRVVSNDASCDPDEFACEVRAIVPGARTSVEARRNIAHARNSAISMGAADAFLFIDDDEIPTSGWLNALLARMGDADAAFGPVVGRPTADTPRWLVRSGAFDKPGPDHDGRIGWTGSRTSSTAVRGAWFTPGTRWFDPDYGISGGSDVEFFKRLAGAGATLVHERRALVYEDVEANRCTWRAVLKRRYRAGAVLGRMERPSRTRPLDHAVRGLRLLKRVAFGSLIALAGVASLPVRGPGVLFQGVCRVAVGLGAFRGFNHGYRVVRYAAAPAAITPPALGGA